MNTTYLYSNPEEGPAPLTCNMGAAQLDGAPIVSFFWDFGDGGTSTSQYVTHTFAEGVWEVTCLVTYAHSSPLTELLTIFITSGVEPPAPNSSIVTPEPQIGSIPLTVQFTAEQVSGEGTFDSVSWNFGDGNNGTGPVVSHTYTEVGSYVVECTIFYTGGGLQTIETVVLAMPAAIPSDETIVSLGPNTLVVNLPMLADEDWSSIALRGMTSTFPRYSYDNGGYPLRHISVWPVPNVVSGIELWCWEQLNTFELNEEVQFPPGYERYLKYKLAVELAAEFGKTVTQDLLDSLREAEHNIRTLNQEFTVAQASGAARALNGKAGKYQDWNYLTMVSGDFALRGGTK